MMAPSLPKIDFCVRFSLQVPGNGDPVEVNSIAVTLFVDLSDGFAIGEADIRPAGPVVHGSAPPDLLA
jgi:hypothetical protein